MGCERCGGRGEIVVCIDDMCRGAGECMHGDGMETCDCELDDVSDGYDEDEGLDLCACPYCPCSLRANAGEICAHCLDGAHQG